MVSQGVAGAVWLAGRIGNQFGGMFLSPSSPYSLAALLITLTVLVLLVTGRRRRPIRPRVLLRALFPRRLWRSASGRTDAAFFVTGIAFSGLTIGWAILSAELVRTAFSSPAPAVIAAPGWVSAVVATIALFVALDFAYWLDHWLSHRIPFLWQFHKVHHQAESLSLLTNGRVHPVDTILFQNITAVVTGLTLVLLDRLFGTGATPFTYYGSNVLVLVAAVALTHLQHSHLWVRFGPRWGRMLLGPAHHQLHHSADPAHYDCNMGNCLAIFDRLFGTFIMPPARRPALRFGVDDGTPAPHGWHAATIAPFVTIAAMIARGLARRPQSHKLA